MSGWLKTSQKASVLENLCPALWIISLIILLLVLGNRWFCLNCYNTFNWILIVPRKTFQCEQELGTPTSFCPTSLPQKISQLLTMQSTFRYWWCVAGRYVYKMLKRPQKSFLFTSPPTTSFSRWVPSSSSYSLGKGLGDHIQFYKKKEFAYREKPFSGKCSFN